VGLITSVVLAAPGCAARVPSQVCHVSPLGSRSEAATLLADVSQPVSQEDMVSNWEPAHSLVGDVVSGAQIAPCLPTLAVARLPLCHQRGGGPVHSWLDLLWCSLNPLFCEVRAFQGEVLSLFFPFSPWLSYSLGCYLTLAPSDCLQGILAWS